MSEEEIIENIENKLKNLIELDDGLYIKGVFKADIIQGLLDLYNKEKEKNKKLYEIKYVASTFIERPMSQFSIGEFRYRVNNSICKDKIKAKIEELEVLEENSTKAFILKCQTTILQELLEDK